MNANNITIVGRLGMKPSVKGYTRSDGTSGTRCFFRVMATRLSDLGKPQEQRRVNALPVVTWGKLAERCAQYLDKGTEVVVIGELIQDSRKLDDGSYQEFIQIQANSVQFGRRSMKQASPENLQSQLNAIQASLAAQASGHGSEAAAGAPASEPTPAQPAESGNPFETPSEAAA